MAELPDPLQEKVPLQEGSISGIHERVAGPVEVGTTATLALQRLLEFLEWARDLCCRLVEIRLGVGISVRGTQIYKRWHVLDPGAVDRALDGVLRVQARRVRLVQVFGDRARFEQRYPIVQPQHRHFVVWRDGAEPVGPIIRFDVLELEIDIFLTQYDRDTLHPGA